MREFGEELNRIKSETKTRNISTQFRSNHNYFCIKFMASTAMGSLINDIEQISRSLQNNN